MKFFYEDVFRELNKEKIKYLVVGGIALNLHGIPRMTADLDSMLDFDEENLENFVGLMKGLGYLPKVPVRLKDFCKKEIREKMKKKGFKYYLEDEKIIEYLKLSPVDRLRWLEEANRFIEIVLPKEKRKIWEKYRRGEI
jgi:hypothetical protein